MIWESWYWKQPLLDMAARLRLLKTGRRRLTEKRLVELERDIFIGFYSIRKILDGVTRVTDATRAVQIQLSWYPNRAEVNWRNNHRIDKLYDLESVHQETRDLEFINGKIIHSFIFIPYVTDKGRLDGIFFTSDRDKQKKLHSMTIDDIIAVFERVGNDDPTSVHWEKHPDGKETFTIT
jgi:hypothetical protein